MALFPEPVALLQDARDLLSAWREGLARDQAVVAWAADLVERMPVGMEPEWLLDLSLYGPATCMSRPSSDFVAVPVPPFRRAFALRATLLDTGDDSQVETFVKWVSGACMGENLDEPIVRFGYHLDHLWGDCGRMDLAAELVRAELPSLRATLPPISESVLRATRPQAKDAG